MLVALGVWQLCCNGCCEALSAECLFNTLQEWNEIQYNGVYYEPPKKGAPGELPTYDTSYTFRYPRPPK